MTVGGEVMSLQDFITLFNGRLRLRAWTIGFDGEHGVIDEPVPVSAATVAASGGNVFRVSVSAAWMMANDNVNGRSACAIRRIDRNTIEYSFFRRSSHGAGPFHFFNTYKRETLVMEVE